MITTKKMFVWKDMQKHPVIITKGTPSLIYRINDGMSPFNSLVLNSRRNKVRI